MSESYFQMVRGMWLLVLCVNGMSGMVYFNCVQDNVSVHRGSFFPFLISAVSVQRIKMVVLQFRFQDSKIWFFNHDLHERSILGSLSSYFWVLNFNLYSVFFLCFNIFVNWCKLLMHISLCIFVNSLWFISWPICKYLESHFFKAYLKLSCGFGVLFVCSFVCFGWGGGRGEKGFLGVL